MDRRPVRTGLRSMQVAVFAHAGGSGSIAGDPEFARRLERLGYDEMWVVEDCFAYRGLAAATTARLQAGSVASEPYIPAPACVQITWSRAGPTEIIPIGTRT